MSGAVFILAINLIVAGFLSAAFLFIAAYDRSMVSSRWVACSYAMGAAYGALEFAIVLFRGAPLVVVAAYMSFAAALALFNVGLARKYDVKLPWAAQGAMLLAAGLVAFLTLGMDRTDPIRNFLYQAPYVALQGLSAWIVWRSGSSRPLDRLFTLLLSASALQFAMKPVAGLLLGVGARADTYIGTTYAMVSQATGIVFAIAVALTMLIVTMRDLLSEMEQRSRTDPLSGVLNRRGFEERAALLLEAYKGSKVPLSLILCDLDHFKLVNDTFGHYTGDLVIAAFARQMSRAAASSQVTGRVGGEEFAIILPGANAAMARLYAENIRSTFASLHIADAPAGRSFTASFGVAEFMPGESVTDLMARADAALYQAKTAGRDCVRIASQLAGDHGPIVAGRAFRTRRGD